jgi:hypothetical protein
MSEKMMSFEEWKDSVWDIATNTPPLETGLKELFDKARLGTIPAWGVIAAPPVEKWDAETTELAIYAYDQHGCQQFYLGTVPRPTPAWTPKVGEAVFAKIQPSNKLIVGRIHRVSGEIVDIEYDGIILGGTFLDVKPFSESKIGKPWSEI